MNPQWTGRVFDERYAPARAGVLALVLLGDLLLVLEPEDGSDRALAVGALLLYPLAARRPWEAVLCGSVLVTLGHGLGSGIVPALKITAAVTVFELALRRAGRLPAAGASALALAVVINRLGDLPEQALSVLYKAGVVAGLPLLLGAYVRGVRDAAFRAREDAERRAERAGQRAATARAAERAAIARELHDLVAHHVSSMVLRVGVARHVLPPTDARVRQVLDDLHTAGSTALADLRRLVAVLRDPGNQGVDCALVDPAALPTALHSVADRGRLTGLSVELALDPDVARLDAVRGLAVLRLAQEGLSNTAKHAGTGTRARLTVRVTGDDVVHLELDDDGGKPARAPSAADRAGPPSPALAAPPLPAAVAARPVGHGLIGMHERVELLGGHLEVGPHGAGWRLSATLPGPGRPWTAAP